MGRGRLPQNEMHQIKKALANLIYNHKDEVKFIDGRPSSVQLSQLLKEKYGYKITRQAISRFLKAGLDEYRQAPIIADNDKIRDIKEAMRVQKAIWNDDTAKPNDRTKAANSWRALNKQLIDYEELLANTKIKIAESNRPIHQIRFEPPEILIKCPKCKHEWYNIKKEKGKEPFFKKDEIQKSFDDLCIEVENGKDTESDDI